ncbi:MULTISPECIES: YesL family protein [unclassified Fredinandcohnia]|uniref:YesL family protein n=1 Tax=unclassified Fredinandcohnia TaxID=2837514 RepID=UPI0030FDB4AC
MNGIASGYYRLCVSITKFAYLNLLWVGFALLGLIVFGFMPATVAMFAVVRKWIIGEKDIDIFRSFWKSYKSEFVKSNIIGISMLLIGYLLSIEFQILRSQESLAYFIASYGVIALFLIYIIILLYIFPLFVHFNLKIGQYVKWSFVIGMVHPILTIFLLVIISISIYLSLKFFPAFLFFFGGSVIAYVVMWGTAKTFPKYEKASEI